jgi:hypothetical protein
LTPPPTSTRPTTSGDQEQKINYKNTGLTGPAPSGMTGGSSGARVGRHGFLPLKVTIIE